MEDSHQAVQGLTSLPTEVLSRILIHVDGSDISTLQQKTCQTLHSVTMTRQFWYNRIRRLCEEHVFPPEEELKEYSTAELKQWTMRRIHARSTSAVKLQLRSRDPPMLKFYEDTFLVPGGRWLLKPHDNLSVYFVDLDSSHLELCLLLDPKKDNPRISNHVAVGYRILIDHKAPRLAFRFQGSLVDSRSSGDLPFTYASRYIYQVNLIGHGASATLVAQIIATFRCKERDTGFTHAFNNRYFAQGREDYLLTDPAVEIFDYRQALGCFNYPTLMDSHTLPLSEVAHHLEFINEDVLAIYCDMTDSYHIFNIESPTSFKLLHEIKLPVLPFDFSRTYWTPEASLMTFTSPTSSTFVQRDIERIFGLVIPHDSKLRPWTVEIGRFVGSKKGYITFKPGIFVSLLYNSETGTNSRLVHEWDYTCESSCSGPTRTSPLEQEVDQFWLPSAFDEDTGRSVSFQSQKLQVADSVSL